MRTGTASILLKARPTPEQLADRMAPPRPDGIELYLDVRDISGDDWLTRLISVVEVHLPREGFDLIVEGPLRSLDGSFFDISESSESNREVVRRVTDAARALGAHAAVLHLMAARTGAAPSDPETRRRALESSLELSRQYASACVSVGVVPTLENVPPVARMRESQYLQTLIGMDPSDLLFVVERVPEIRITLDVSHAQLYLNCLGAEAGIGASEGLPRDVGEVLAGLRASPSTTTLDGFITMLEPYVESVHISNASGVLGEGLPYEQGDIDLDSEVVRLAGFARSLVTETIEPNSDRAVFMRQAQERMLRALGRHMDGAKL
jgi:sugar phosphate isomerase/epimerase